jgi:hypothetical protein
MTRNLIVTALVAGLMGVLVLGVRGRLPFTRPVVPPIKGYTEGQEVLFLHTEVSDAQMAQILTNMTGSPVLVVPSLAQTPEEGLANVYVFTNGVTGGGPLGFQPDVFDHPPGTPGYSPLRAALQVTWKNEPSARELKSAAQVKEAEAQGEVTIQRTGVVVNMPFVTWPGGQR